MLIAPSVAFAALSALSVAAPLALWPAPSPARTASLAHSWTPESVSEQAKRTRTALLNQPAAFAERAVPSSLTVAPLIAGGVRSIWTPLTEPEPGLLALSEMLTGPAPRFDPSPVMVLSAGCVAGSIPDSKSWPVQWIVTLPLYQPYAFGRSEEHTSELQSRENLVCRLLLEIKKNKAKMSGMVRIKSSVNSRERTGFNI